MHLWRTLSTLSLASTVVASVLNLNIYTDTEASIADIHHDQSVLVETKDAKTKEDKPGWKTRDERHLIPLVPEARTGVLPVDIEEGLISALGPRFANEFINAALQETNNASALVGSCSWLSCAGTVIKAAPCVAAAIACECVAPVIACPTVSQKDICGCLDCLPDIVIDIIKKIGFCTSSLQDLPSLPAPATADEGLDYGNFIPYSQRAPYLLAYRGDISKATLDEASELAAAGFCPGSQCGDCACCLGVCAFGNCVGACV